MLTLNKLTTATVLLGDCIEQMRTLEPESVQCCVTSPPYWGLRDYGHAGQIGLEVSPDAYVEKLLEVFSEVRRVLKPDGTLWLNLGDSYCNTDKWGGGGKNTGKQTVAADGSVPSWAVRAKKPSVEGVKPKDLMMMPATVAIALRGDGWWLRSKIVWHKPNPMPESVTDRPTKAHEEIFLLSKSETYLYDTEAIAEPAACPEGPGKYGDAYAAGAEEQRTKVGLHKIGHRATRRARDVWTIASQPYDGAHFAVFPEELPRRCILAGSRGGDLVLDPFTGSGTTGAVALKLGRRFVGCELNPAYRDLALERMRVTPGFNFEVTAC